MTKHGRLGDFRYVPDGVAIRYDRRVEASPATVWAALTDPDVLARWLGEVTVADRAVTLRLDGETATATGTIVYCEPRQMLEVDLHWAGEPAARLVAEVAELGENRSIVVVEYRGVPDAAAAERGAQWHARIDALAAVVTGDPLPSGAPADLVPAYQLSLAELNSGY
jgi:uncharacterized protein YndB with AHSA1/START domain